MESDKYKYGKLGRPPHPKEEVEEEVKLQTYCKPESSHVYALAYTTRNQIIFRCKKCGLSQSRNRWGSDPDERYRMTIGNSPFRSTPRYGMD
tara:strand:- start:11 stop:286 length:276 start_codon:yes stop_codon:yes gene_type:complete